jgi:mono/diheme cytochrome c family protein
MAPGEVATMQRTARRRPSLIPGILALCAAGTFVGAAAAQQAAPAPAPKVVVTEYDMRKAAAPPSLSPVELSGKKLFVQRCALCHDLLGQPATTTVGPWLDVETAKRSEEAVRQKIMNGSSRMPAWKYTLAPPQIDSIVAYLKTVTPDQKPKPGGTVTGPIE